MKLLQLFFGIGNVVIIYSIKLRCAGDLSGYNFSSSDVADVDSRVRTYHRIVEAFKFAYAKRSLLGDEDFVNVTEVRRNFSRLCAGLVCTETR